MACSGSRRPIERIAILPFENLSGDATFEWIAAAGPEILKDQLLGGATAVPARVASLRDAYAFGASRLVHGHFEKRRESLHYEFLIEDAQVHKTLQTVAGDGDILPVVGRLAKEIDSGAHPFSSTNSEAVAAWGRGEFERAVSLDPDFGPAWLNWAQSRSAAGDSSQALEIVQRALRQTGLRSPLDRAQLDLLSATLRQDEPARQRSFAALVRLIPNDAALLRQLASQETNARRFTQAVQLYQDALRVEPDSDESLNLLGYAQAFAGDLDGARKSFQQYGSKLANPANALDSEGEALFLYGKFAEAEKLFLDAHSKNGAMLGGGDLLKAAYARWLQGDLAGADQIFARYIAFRNPQKDSTVVWRQAVWEYSTGRAAAALTRLAGVNRPGPLGDLARSQVALWRDPSKIPNDPAALRKAYERTPPASDAIIRVLYAAALVQAGQKDDAKKLMALWPLPGSEGDPLLQSFLFPKYLDLKQQLK